MLQSIRDRATGMFAWVIVILLIVPFALWGIQEYLGGGTAINVANVEGTTISRNTLNSQVDLQLRGEKDRPEGEELKKFRRDTLDKMIQEELLYKAAVDSGLTVHEALVVDKIRNNPNFQVDGAFSQQRYEELLRFNSLDPTGYQATLARELLIQQYIGGILNTGFVTTQEVNELLKLQGRQLELSYIQIPLEKYKQNLSVTDEQIEKYYQEHEQNFVTPEKVRLNYLLLSSESIQKQINLSEQQLQEYYQVHKDSFTTLEQRQVAHILIEKKSPSDKEDSPSAQQQIEKVYAELQQGTDFSEMAKKYSDDPGSANLGGDIGFLEPGIMPAGFESAVNELQVAEYSKPVETNLGYHIIKLLAIKPATNKSFAEARDDVKKTMAADRAENLFLDQKEVLYNLTFENPESLEIAARDLDLEIKTTPWFGRNGLEADKFLSDPNVLAAAFSNDVFSDGNPGRSINSRLIELKPLPGATGEQVAVVRLADYQPSQPQKLQEVKAEIRTTLANKLASEAMNNDMQSWLKQIQDGADMQQLAQQQSVLYKDAGWIGRGEQGYDPILLSSAFKTPKKSQAKASYSTSVTIEGDGVIYAVKGIKDGEVKAEDPMRNFMSQFMQRSQTTAELAAFIAQLKAQADIEIFEERLSSEDIL